MADGAHQEKPISVFYSYSHRDEELRKKLEDHLATLRWSEKITEWHDRNIDVGDEWAKEIDRNLTSADVILLLVSASFIASNYCWSVEIRKALERHDKGEAKVIPIILRPCAWQTTPFANLQAAPTDAKPVTSWSDPDEALYDVARKIERAVNDLQQRHREQEWVEAGGLAAKERPLASNTAPTPGPLHLPDIVLLGLMLITILSLGGAVVRRWPQHEQPPAAEETARRSEEKPVVASLAPAPAPVTRPLKPLETFRDCAECPEMIVIPAGSFMMGSPATESERERGEGPQHRVSMGPFAIGKTEVTFAQWDACVNAGGCNAHKPPDQGWGRGSRPVVDVSWNDAKAYVSWLSQHTGKPYRLPSEAEWEYAARAEATTRYAFGDAITPKDANYVAGGARPPRRRVVILVLGTAEWGSKVTQLKRGSLSGAQIFAKR